MRRKQDQEDRVGTARQEQWSWPPELPVRRIHPAHVPRRAELEWPWGDRDADDESTPPQGRPEPQVAVRAAITHNRVADPETGRPWSGADNPVDLEKAARPAFAQAVTMLQEDAVGASITFDLTALEAAERAAGRTAVAETARERTERIHDDVVEYPPGGSATVREVMADYEADRKVGDERRREGDSRHEVAPVARHWVVLAAVLLAVLDVALLWRPLLGLGALDDAGALYKWALAVGFAGLQAFFIDLAVNLYREADRDSAERRARVGDHNRWIDRAIAARDKVAMSTPPPPAHEVKAADDRMRTRRRWLYAAAAGVGIVGVFRVAFLSRAAGQSLAEAVVFGSVVGLVLGGLVVLLARLACRGNRLGDRLRAGAAVQLAVDERVAEGREEVARARAEAGRELVSAERARVWAVDVREWVVAQYRSVILLAASWLDLERPPIDDNELISPRRLEVADAAKRLIDAVQERLAVVDAWLGDGAATTSRDGHVPHELPIGTAGKTAALGPFVVPASGIGGGDGLVDMKVRLGRPPAEPRWLVAVGCAVVVVVAVTAAWIAPTPEGIDLGDASGGGAVPEVIIQG